MCCADCDYRNKDYCCLLDDVILSYANTCFMDNSNDFNNSEIVNNDGDD